jgi:Spy/CpxP family protein refolding chaperone
MAFTLSAWLVQSGIAASQETPNASPPAAKVAGAKAEKLTGRVPAYYKTVVTDDQRQQIYKIMAEYTPRLIALKGQLNQLTNEQDKRIEALLTPEQKQKIAQLKAAKANRHEMASEKKAPAKDAAAEAAKPAAQPQPTTEAKK